MVLGEAYKLERFLALCRPLLLSSRPTPPGRALPPAFGGARAREGRAAGLAGSRREPHRQVRGEQIETLSSAKKCLIDTI